MHGSSVSVTEVMELAERDPKVPLLWIHLWLSVCLVGARLLAAMLVLRCSRRARSAGLQLSSLMRQTRAPASLAQRRHYCTDDTAKPPPEGGVRMHDVLKHVMHDVVEYVVDSQTVVEALQLMIDEGVGSVVVKDSNDRLVGFLTQRDILRTIRKHCDDAASDTETGGGGASAATAAVVDGVAAAGVPSGWNVTVRSVMTLSKDRARATHGALPHRAPPPRCAAEPMHHAWLQDLVFLSPNDTLDDARAVMYESGKRHVPVLQGESLLGIVGPKDIARCLHLERAAQQVWDIDV